MATAFSLFPLFFFFCWRSIAGPELIWPGLSWARQALVYELIESHESIIISKAEFGEPWNAYFRRPQVLRVCEKLEGQENKKKRENNKRKQSHLQWFKLQRSPRGVWRVWRPAWPHSSEATNSSAEQSQR